MPFSGEEMSFSSKKDSTKMDLIVEALRDVRTKRAQEMRKGYYNTKTDRNGNVQKTWIPDTREQYINSVIALDLLLSADHKKEYKKAKEEIIKKAEKAFKKWGWKLFTIKKIPIEKSYNNYKWMKNYTGEIIMPEPDTSVVDINPNGKRIKINWANQYHQYMQSLVLIYDELYKTITELLQLLRWGKEAEYSEIDDVDDDD